MKTVRAAAPGRLARVPHVPARGLAGARRSATGLALSLALAGPAWAASSASWVSLEGVSASVGSLSASVQTASESSARPLRQAQGPHRVTRLEPAPDPTGLATLHLQPVARAVNAMDAVIAPQPQAEGLVLRLPAHTLRATGLAVGDRVEVRDEAHGLEFAHGEPARLFFLALRDAGLDQLRTRPLRP